METIKNYSLSAYSFDLPEDLIAQHPAAERGESRLMVLDKNKGLRGITTAKELASLLPPNSLLVANNSRVFPARLPALRPGGGKAEFFLLTPLPHLQCHPPKEGWQSAPVEGLARPLKRLRPGMRLDAGENMYVELRELGQFGRVSAELHWRGQNAGDLLQHLLNHGKIPLPPYIRRQPTEEDSLRYQTTFSRAGQEEGSVAAPTAGLHFTPQIMADLRQAGHEWREVTLHVGYGTFSPVRSEDIRQHAMHQEYYTISDETAAAVNRALSDKRPIVAIGTTSARTLEGAFRNQGTIAPHSGTTDIFIYPGYSFNVVSGLFTNFHLPESTLLMLVSALTGRERLLDAYAAAVRERMRFFSYGDAMLVL